MLIPRIITAIILITLVLIGIFFLPPLGFNLISALMIFIAGWEFSALLWKNVQFTRIVFICSLLLLFIFTQYIPAKPVLIIGVVWWIFAPLFLWLFVRKQHSTIYGNIFGFLVGILLFIPCLVGLNELRFGFGINYLLYLLAIIAAADIGAYFIGYFFGKTLLAPQISPKKTIEGLVGGVLFAMLVAVIGAKLLAITGFKLVLVLTLVLLTILWSVIGDLFESVLKRQANVKDSGQLLPGHGGIYDRIDSLTAATPIFTLGLILLM